MRFESFLWTLIAALVLSWSGVVETATAPVNEDGAQFQAADGSNEVPPPTTKP